jgi:Rad3-related DNA helicase
MPLLDLQQQTVDMVKDAMKEYKFIFVDAPPGSGKSLINLYSAKGKKAYVTTPQRLLVKQYLNSIENVPVYDGLGVGVMGKATYRCNFLTEKEGVYQNCDGAPCSEKVNGEMTYCKYYKSGCEYRDAVRIAQNSPVTITTLPYALMAIMRGIQNHAMLTREEAEAEAEDPENLKGWFMRDILIIDEAHSFDDAITGFFTVDLTPYSFDQQIEFDVLLEKIREKSNELENIVNQHVSKEVKDVVVKNASKELRTIIINHVSEIIEKTKTKLEVESSDVIKKTLRTRIERMEHLVLKLNYDVDYVIQTSDVAISIKPYSPAPFIKSFLYAFENVIFSSATFVNLDLLTKSLGIEPQDWVEISVPSTFDPNKAPIVFDSVGKINRDTLESTLPKIVKVIDEYSNLYNDQRVLVHCHTYQIQNYIAQNMPEPNRTRLITHSSKDRESQEKEFEISANGIFLSVNMTEGLDLKDDLCRLQIIVKCPYLNLGDKWIKEHYDRDGKVWYDTKTLSTVIQACGRIIRNNEDWGVTVILDPNIFYLIERYKSKTPESFMQRIRK